MKTDIINTTNKAQQSRVYILLDVLYLKIL